VADIVRTATAATAAAAAAAAAAGVNLIATAQQRRYRLVVVFIVVDVNFIGDALPLFVLKQQCDQTHVLDIYFTQHPRRRSLVLQRDTHCMIGRNSVAGI
jgi:hypothetical protein